MIEKITLSKRKETRDQAYLLSGAMEQISSNSEFSLRSLHFRAMLRTFVGKLASFLTVVLKISLTLTLLSPYTMRTHFPLC